MDVRTYLTVPIWPIGMASVQREVPLREVPNLGQPRKLAQASCYLTLPWVPGTLVLCSTQGKLLSISGLQ